VEIKLSLQICSAFGSLILSSEVPAVTTSAALGAEVSDVNMKVLATSNEELVNVYVRGTKGKDIKSFVQEQLHATTSIPPSKQSLVVSIPRSLLTQENVEKWQTEGFHVEESKRESKRKRSCA
jgi:hypothetical protein